MSRASREIPAVGLHSKDRADHPHAVDRTCQLGYPHSAHPYGRIAEDRAGLVWWCGGAEHDPTGGR